MACLRRTSFSIATFVAGVGCHPGGSASPSPSPSRCGGMPYRGESFVACMPEARGFSPNCPTVGCISLGR
jgi:hypothetical protein